MQVERVSDPGTEWDAYAEAHPGVCVGHAAAWASVMRESYGLEPHYLAARSPTAELAGVLPLVRFPTPLRSAELISLPYLDAAGILASDLEAEAALRVAALELADSLAARALELRQPRPLCAGVDQPANGGGEAGSGRVNLVLKLECDEESQWKALRAKVRNQTRKAEREDLEIAEGTSDELLADFYGPFQVNMRDLGSPVHARAFFRCAARHFGARLRFVVARLGDRPVGGLVAIRYGNAVSVPWASTLRSERRRCPNNLIYWEALRWAIRQGAQEFDFGRSPQGSGTHRFKLGWGAREESLAWLRQRPDGSPIPMTVSNPGALLQRLSRLWTRLPVPVAGALGPRIRRYLSN